MGGLDRMQPQPRPPLTYPHPERSGGDDGSDRTLGAERPIGAGPALALRDPSLRVHGGSHDAAQPGGSGPGAGGQLCEARGLVCSENSLAHPGGEQKADASCQMGPGLWGAGQPPLPTPQGSSSAHTYPQLGPCWSPSQVGDTGRLDQGEVRPKTLRRWRAQGAGWI